MNSTLVILLTVTAVWLTAGVVVDRRPGSTTARGLRRRTDVLIGLTATGLATMAAVALVAAGTVGPTRADEAVRALALPAVPAAAVAISTLRRLLRLRSGVAAFAAIPGIPPAPVLRAGAAHPMVALPPQVAGLVAVPGLVRVTGAAAWGLVLTVTGLAALAVGVRHALRHSRLAEAAVTLRPRSAGRVHALPG